MPKNPHMRTRLLACVSRFLGLLFSPMAPAIAGEPPRVLLVGLGNPGKRYRGTRHNVGQEALTKIVGAMTDVVPFNQVGGVRLAVGTLGSVRVAAALPLSYMNICGGAVGAVARQLNLQPGSVLILHDDLDLPPGKVKVKKGGGSGGHNGLKSCASTLGEGFWRMRIGVGRPEDKLSVPDFVLGAIPPGDLEALQLDSLAAYAPLLFDGSGQISSSSVSTFLNMLARPEGATRPVGARTPAVPRSDGESKPVRPGGEGPSVGGAAGGAAGGSPQPLPVSTGLFAGARGIALGCSEASATHAAQPTRDVVTRPPDTRAAPASATSELEAMEKSSADRTRSPRHDARGEGGRVEEACGDLGEQFVPPKRAKSSVARDVSSSREA